MKGHGIDGNGAGIESAVAPSPPRYKKFGSVMIRPLVFAGDHCAFDIARMYYAKFPNLNFWDDLVDYHRHGFVTTRPTCFGMVKAIEHEGRRGWFVRIAIGNLLELITTLPGPLDFIAFCRDDDDNMRVVQWEAFLKRATRKMRMEHEFQK
jgi:hypothetical protein